MELLNVQKARSVWLFDSNDLNPRGRSIGTDLFEWIKARYHFEKVPSSVSDLDKTKALHFGNGKFRVREDGSTGQPLGEDVTVELRVYNDGIVGDTRSSSKDTDAFLADVLDSATREFGLSYTPALIRRKLYVSELNVRMGASMMLLNPKLDEFTAHLRGALGSNSPTELAGLAFWPDVVPKPDQFVFRLERKWGFAFSEQRYLAIASLQTERHIELLSELEQMLSSYD